MIVQATSEEQLTFNGTPLVICFTNPYTCAPCRLLKPHFENAARALGDDALFTEVDIVENFDLAAAFGVTQTPTLFFVGEGDERTVLESRNTLPLIAEITNLLGK